MPHIDWQELYEAAMLEMNPENLVTRIGAAEQATRSMLKSLSRIASSQGKRAAYYEAALQPGQHERLG